MRVAKRWIGVLFIMFLGLAGCHELGHMDGPGDYGSQGHGDVVGEIRNVDTRNRVIRLRTDAGRNLDVRYDNRTRVRKRSG